MGTIPRKEFSQTDPDDEIDLESLVKKASQPAQKKDAMQPHTAAPIQENVVPPAAPGEEFDVASFPKAQAPRPAAASPKQPAPATPVATRNQTQEAFEIESLRTSPVRIEKSASREPYLKPAEQKTQPPVATAAHLRKEPAEGRSSEAETEFDHPVQRKKVRILPSFPTLILIIIVSIVAAVLTGTIVTLTGPSLQTKMQEILSNQENTSLKLNSLEQTVAKLLDDMKILQNKANSHQAVPVPVKKHAPKAAPASNNAPAQEGTTPE